MKLSQIGSGIVPDVLPKATWEPGEEMGRCQIPRGGYRTGLFYSVWLQLCIKHKDEYMFKDRHLLNRCVFKVKY